MGRYPYTDWSGAMTTADSAVVVSALETMGLTALAHCPMNALSDGERQKAMIARALAQEPKVLLLDEAMAHLDLPRRVELMQRLRELARCSGCAILLSCHDLDLTLRYADRLWLIAQGGQLREGIPEDLVLSGGFEATFPTGASLVFDPYQGAFVPSRSPVSRIAVEGDALMALWAKRALERIGFEVVREDAEWRVVLSTNRRHLPDWRLLGRSCGAGCGLESLLAALQAPSTTTAKGTVDELQ
jgi:iron complex transport system ATP-binding protein